MSWVVKKTGTPLVGVAYQLQGVKMVLGRDNSRPLLCKDVDYSNHTPKPLTDPTGALLWVDANGQKYPEHLIEWRKARPSKQDVYAEIALNPTAAMLKYLPEQADGIAHFSNIPNHCKLGAAIYLILGVKPESFLTAIFAGEHDLALKKADAVNTRSMPLYREFLANTCPVEAIGSSRKVRDWVECGGAFGLSK